MKLLKMTTDHWKWLHKRCHPIMCADTIGITAIDHKSNIMAVAAMDSWAPNSCQLHWAIDNKMVLRHGFIEELCEFVFNTRGRSMIIGLVPSDNHLALKLNQHIGMTEVGRVKDGYKIGSDLVIMQLHRDTCRWLTEEAA
jgi:hypothetical protein